MICQRLFISSTYFWKFKRSLPAARLEFNKFGRSIKNWLGSLMKPVSYWISSGVLSVANIFILSSLSDSRGLCWALLVSNTGPCNYPMYKQQTLVCVLAVLSPLLLVTGYPPPHLSQHCQADTTEMVSIKPSLNFNLYLEKFSRYSTLTLIRSDWVLADSAGSGDRMVPYNKMPISPAHRSEVALLYTSIIYILSVIILSERKTQPGRDRGHSSKRRRL